MNLLTLKEAAAMLGVSKRTVRRLIDLRQLPFYKVASLVKVSEKDILEYLESNRVSTKSVFHNHAK